MLYMQINRNRAMLSLLGGDPDFTEPSSEPIPDGLRELLAEGFEETSGMLLFRSLAVVRSSLLSYLVETEDETGAEVGVNEIKIERYIEGSIEFTELARLGCDFAFLLANTLRERQPNTGFRVIVSAMPGSSSDRVGDTCVVRFHQRRNGQIWLDDNLEAYREEAIEVLDL